MAAARDTLGDEVGPCERQPVNRLSVWGKGEKIARRGKGKGEPPFPQTCSLQCRRVLGGRNLVPVVRVRDIVVAAIFDFMTV